MNAMVGVRANAAGLNDQPFQKRAAAARQVSANIRAKIQAVMKLQAAMKSQAAVKSQAPVKSQVAVKTQVATKAGEAVVEENENGERVVRKEMGRDAFLQLLVLQMQNQDPLEPVDNADMLAQLAQFSSLEQMNNLNESFEKLGADFSHLSFVTAGNLVGRTVSGTDANGIEYEGEVTRAVLDEGTVYLQVGEGLVPLANVVEVE